MQWNIWAKYIAIHSNHQLQCSETKVKAITAVQYVLRTEVLRTYWSTTYVLKYYVRTGVLRTYWSTVELDAMHHYHLNSFSHQVELSQVHWNPAKSTDLRGASQSDDWSAVKLDAIHCNVALHLFKKNFIRFFDTSASMIPPSVSEISALDGFCDEDEQELGILVVG